jgi:hypothetical protein
LKTIDRLRPFGLVCSVAIAWLAATPNARAGESCLPPVSAATSLLEKIEGNVDDPNDLSKIYKSLFTADLRRQWTEQDFIKNVQTGVLFVSSARLPPLSRRVISASVDTERRRNDWTANDQHMATGAVVEVHLLSAGRTGRIRQTVTMRCEHTIWKVMGLEYEAAK